MYVIFSTAKGSKIDANQEMLAIGTTNLLGSFLSAYPTTGSFARTTINADSGVRTPMNGLFTGIVFLKIETNNVIRMWNCVKQSCHSTLSKFPV